MNEIRLQHNLSVDDTVDEWVAFMENQQSPEITEDVVYRFESKVRRMLFAHVLMFSIIIIINLHGFISLAGGSPTESKYSIDRHGI